MNSYLSLHILADGCSESDINRAGAFLDNCNCEFYNITTAARYNEAEKIIRLLHAIAPNARPIWRGWDKDALKDGDIWRNVTPQEWINYRIAPNAEWLRELGVYVLTCNEVGVLGPDARVWSAWEAKCIQLAWNQYKVKLAAMRFSTGNPLETEHENYDDVLTAAGLFDALLTPNQYTAIDGNLSTNWHVGRHKWVWSQQDKLGVPRSKVVIGEYALCRFDGNNKPDPNHGYGAMNVNIEQHLTILKRDGVLYQADGITACWFVMGRWQEGGGSFDLQTNEPLLKAVESEAKEGKLNTKTMPVITPTVKPAEIVYGDLYRLNLAGKIITAYQTPNDTDNLPPAGFIPDQAVIEARKTLLINRETWLEVFYTSLRGNHVGWIRTAGVNIRQTVTVPIIKDEVPLPVVIPTPPAPVTPTPTQSLTAAQIAKLESWRDELTAEIAKLSDRKAMVEGMLSTVGINPTVQV